MLKWGSRLSPVTSDAKIKMQNMKMQKVYDPKSLHLSFLCVILQANVQK